MKKTLLEIVQETLSEMDSDEVNSIDETTESLQVASVVRSCYYEMLAHRNWPHTRKLIQVDHSGSLDRPNYLKSPDNLKELITISYLTTKDSSLQKTPKELIYKEPDEFLSIVGRRDNTNSNIEEIVDYGGVKLYILNDVDPTYWTSFDDTYIVTDSYNRAIESTLQKAKTVAVAYLIPAWTHTDDFVPDLPIEAFPGFVEEVKSTASLALKQMPNNKAEQKAKRQSTWLARKAWKLHGGVTYPDYGRRRR